MVDRFVPATPRLMPLEPTEIDEATRTKYGVKLFNIFRTLARYPALLKAWMTFGDHILYGISMPLRERELLILRTGWNCRAEYEFAQHVVIGRREGLTDTEIEATTRPLDEYPWGAADLELLRTADELFASQSLTDQTWSALSDRWSDDQLLDAVFTVGQYITVSMAVNVLGVPLDPAIRDFAVLTRFSDDQKGQ